MQAGRLLLFFSMLSLVSLGVARADERMPSTVSCPEGAEPASVHANAECYPTTCSDDSGCKSGLVCAERALCIETRLTGPLGGNNRVAVGACASDGSCKYPASCETAKRCVKEASGSKLKRACGCELVGLPDGTGALAFVAAVVGASLWRRRRAG